MAKKKFEVSWKVVGNIIVEAKSNQEAENIVLNMSEEEIEKHVLDKIDSFETGSIEKLSKMKQVIIDRGIYKLGIHYANGNETKPNWNSDINGNCLIIGHKEELFSISDINDISFILKELSERLDLKLVSKVEKNDDYYKCSRCGEVFDNQDLIEGTSERKFCYNCGAVLDWTNVIEDAF